MRYSPNENWLVTSDGDGHIKYWKGRNELVKVPHVRPVCLLCPLPCVSACARPA